MGYEYALALEYLTCGQVTTTDLVPNKAQLLKKLKINLSHPITWLVRQSIPITTISIPDDFANNTNHLEELAEDIKQQGLLRPIVIDTNYSLVFGRKRLQANKLLGKKSITPLIIALEVMLKDPHAGYQLKKYFTLSEIIAIGMALETVLGKRQGKRNDLALRPNSDEVMKGRTDEFIADLLKLGSKNSYRLAKKVIQSGNRMLIDLMDEEKISISAAAEITHLSVGEQQNVLLGDPNLILEKMKQSKTNMAVASP